MREYPRIYLDIELYRPRTGSGRVGFFSGKTKIIAGTIAVEYGRDSLDYHVWTDADEYVIIRNIKNKIELLLTKYKRERRSIALIGYNILALDIPFLINRAYRLLDKKNSRALREILLRRTIQVDLFQLALHIYDGPGLPSFTSFYRAVRLARGLEPGAPKGSGYNVHELYEKQDYNEIRKYAYTEIEQLVELYNLIRNPGPIQVSNVPSEWRRLPCILQGNTN